MKIEYDAKTDTLYMQLSDKAVSRTQSINDIILIDLDEDGHPIHIEILSASHYGDVSEVTYRFLQASIAKE